MFIQAGLLGPFLQTAHMTSSTGKPALAGRLPARVCRALSSPALILGTDAHVDPSRPPSTPPLPLHLSGGPGDAWGVRQDPCSLP